MRKDLSRLLFSGSLAAIVSLSVYAEDTTVTVDVPEIIQVLSIDGKEQNSTFFGTRQHKQSLIIILVK